MLGALTVTGSIVGLTLICLLVWTSLDDRLNFWPPPRNGSWQSILFWTLFRILNLTAIALAVTDCRALDGLAPVRVFGAGLAVAGFTLYGMACYELGRTNLYCGRDGLVTGGIYRWTRNPQYATAIPAYLGLAIAANSQAALAISVLLVLTFGLMAFAEERWLEAAYGADYRRYRQEVARFYHWRHGIEIAKREFSRVRQLAKEAQF